MLRVKPIDDITYNDVIEFCQKGLAENIYLDYKVQFPKNLEKTIAAMANSHGGLIIIGVNEDGDRPKAPFVGIDYKDNYRATVESIVHHNIMPPMLVETANCADDQQAKCFVVIRIPQSISTPHALKDASVYVRTGQASNPEQIASIEQLPWLYERRTQSIGLKHELYERSKIRFSNFLIELSGKDELSNAWLSLSICPTFPDLKPLFDYKNAASLLSQIAPRYGMNLRQEKMRAASGGCVNPHKQPELPLGVFDYFELDEHGLFVYRAAAEEPTPLTHNTYQVVGEIPYLVFVKRFTAFLATARELYKSMGYWGYVDFSAEIHNIAGKWVSARNLSISPQFSTILDEPVNIKLCFNVVELIDTFDDLSCRILSRLAHGCSAEGIDDDFHKLLMKNNVPNYAR